jgi:AraC-like DNA-binding protein
MEYARTWRMAVARNLLLRGDLTNAEIAHRVGYGSASAFAMAFAREEGTSPGAFAELYNKAHRDPDVDPTGSSRVFAGESKDRPCVKQAGPPRRSVDAK